MHFLRKKRLYVLLLLVSSTAVIASLVLFALRQNINLFYLPDEINTTSVPVGINIKLGGVVKTASVYKKSGLNVEFVITDFKHSLNVTYNGILPDLFKEGQGIVATGKLLDKDNFQAYEVLAKHDENYMPPGMDKPL